MLKLTCVVATLNRFVSKSTARCCLFYQLLKKWKGFQGTEECEWAFQDLKKYLMSVPILSCLDPREDLFMHLAVSEHVVNVVLLKDQGGVQKPIYYISKTLIDVEMRYLPLEKLALADGVCVNRVSSPISA